MSDRLFKYLHKHGRKIGRYALWGSIVATITFIALGLYITIATIKRDITGLETDSINFLLYKNSRFEKCVIGTPERVNCTLVMTDLGGQNIKDGRRFLNKMFFSGGPEAQKYDWCSLVSCLRGYKVIPSSPFQAAFRFSGLMAWMDFTVEVLAGLWMARHLFYSKKHDPEDCKGFDIVDGFMGTLNLAMFVFWWYSFFVLAFNAQNISQISIFGWITPWNFAIMLNFHPFACRFNMESGRERVLVWVMATVALVQWIATCYAIHVTRDVMYFEDGEYPKYRCLESAISQAPGTSLCSPQQLCSKDWLFSNDSWSSWTPWDEAQANYIKWFYVLSIAAFAFPIQSLRSSRGRSLLNFSTSEVTSFMLFGAPFTFLFFAMLSQSQDVLSEFNNPTYPPNREGPVAYDVDCQALHVYLSPWKFYLDVDGYNRALRIARMWLNA
jgi:hypothetical protein